MRGISALRILHSPPLLHHPIPLHPCRSAPSPALASRRLPRMLLLFTSLLHGPSRCKPLEPRFHSASRGGVAAESPPLPAISLGAESTPSYGPGRRPSRIGRSCSTSCRSGTGAAGRCTPRTLSLPHQTGGGGEAGPAFPFGFPPGPRATLPPWTIPASGSSVASL